MPQGDICYFANNSSSEVRVCIEPDPELRIIISFEKNAGTFKRLEGRIDKEGNDRHTLTFLGQAPLVLNRVVLIDDKELAYDLLWMDEPVTLTVDELINRIREYMNSNKSEKLTLISLFLRVLAREYLRNEDVDRRYSSVIHVSGGEIRCATENVRPVKESLSLLREFYELTTNQRAFLSAFSYCLTAPLHQYVREYSDAGYMTPYEVLCGRTKGGKTSLASIFTLKGYALDKHSGFLSANRVKSLFTLTKHLSTGNLPVVINDVSLKWFDHFLEALKSGAETSDFGDRGNQNKTMEEYAFTRSPIVTLNEDWVPTREAAMNRRLIIEHYGLGNENRQNMAAYNQLLAELPPGFMFDIFREAFAGMELVDFVHHITAGGSVEAFVQYGLNRINELCSRYEVTVFPQYSKTEEHPPEPASDLFLQFVEEILEQEHRLDLINQGLRAPYPLITKAQYQVDKHETSEGITQEIYFQTGVYNILRTRINSPHKNLTEFLNNYVPGSAVKLLHNGQHFSKFISSVSMPKTVYGLSYTVPKVEDRKKTAIRYKTDTDGFRNGDEDIVPEDIARELHLRGTADIL